MDDGKDNKALMEAKLHYGWQTLRHIDGALFESFLHQSEAAAISHPLNIVISHPTNEWMNERYYTYLQHVKTLWLMIMASK